MANSEALSLGPGRLYVAPVGTAAPTDMQTALDPAWVPVGYTEEGSEFAYELTSEEVPVAEELDPLFYRTTGRSGTVSFAMAENTARTLSIAFNGGDVSTPGTDGSVVYTPPEPGEEERRSLLFESEDAEERWHWPQVFQGGSVSVARRKGAEKATLPVEMRVEKVSGKPPFSVVLGGVRATDTPAGGGAA